MPKNQKSLRLLLGLCLSIGLTGPAFAANCNPAQLDNLFSLLAKRSMLMKGVATEKFIQQQGLYDARREIEVLQNTMNLADGNQLNADKLMLFSQIQMDLAKQIEQYWLDQWKLHPEEQPDAGITPGISALRQQINQLDGKIYPQIASNLSNLAKCPQSVTLKQWNKAFADIKGIPSNPNYNLLVLSALKNLSH